MISMSQVYSIRQLRKRGGVRGRDRPQGRGVPQHGVQEPEGGRPVAQDAGAQQAAEAARPLPPAHTELARGGPLAVAQAAPHRPPHMGAADDRGGRRVRGVDRARVRARAAGGDGRLGRRRLPRPGLGARRGPGRLRGGRLLRARRQDPPELLRARVPPLQHRHRAGVPLRERRVRLPGARERLRVRRRRAPAHRVRQRHGRRAGGSASASAPRRCSPRSRPTTASASRSATPTRGTRRGRSRRRSATCAPTCSSPCRG